MSPVLKKTLYWTPRVAGILFVLFISLFALDIFEEGLGFWGTLLALAMHLLPSIFLAITVYIAWKWEWFGAALFFGWAIWYLAFVRGQHWSAYALVGGLPALIGLFYLAGWIWRKQIREG